MLFVKIEEPQVTMRLSLTDVVILYDILGQDQGVPREGAKYTLQQINDLFKEIMQVREAVKPWL